jgi:serine phosphatase RsbU (regulator of sigma subunit)
MDNLSKISGFFLVLTIILASCAPSNEPVAINGVLDVSKRPFQKNDIIELKGEWEFYWLKLLGPEDFKSNQTGKSYIKVPGIWNDKQIEGKRGRDKGYATYRLLVKTNPADSVFGIKVNRIDAAFKIWINGQFIYESGKISPSSNLVENKWTRLERIIHARTNVQELIIQVGNDILDQGGIVENIQIADADKLLNATKKRIGLDFLFLGVILIISLYHLILYLQRRVVVSSLYFALLCIAVSAIIVVSQNFNFVFIFWPEIKWAIHYKLESIFYFFSIILLTLFIYSLFERESNKKAIKASILYCIILSLIVAITPVNVSFKIMAIAEWFFIALIIYLLTVSGKAIVSGVEGSFQSLIGLTFLILAVINDIVFKKYFLSSHDLVPFGFLIFIFIQVYIISSKFTKAISYSEQLTEEMDYLNNNLEHLVKERTAKIEQQKEELEIQSDSLKIANDEIVKINHILEKQGGEMNKKNRALTDSLNYAKRLQSAVLPDENYLKGVLPEHFIFFQPKDIVSGDFYWYGEVDSSWDFDDASSIQILIAADCTGHGVPGAFMTLLGHNFLKVTVNIQEVIDPEQIIYKLDQQVVDTLKQNEPNSIKDGMDIAVLIINQDKNLISFSGAGMPLYRITDGELEEYKGSNFGIGGVLRKEKQFTPFKIEYKPGDLFYIFSDGYADQIGGKEGRKYYKKKFKEFLMEIKDYPMVEQRRMIEDEYIQWKGDYKQIDDILVIGLKV